MSQMPSPPADSAPHHPVVRMLTRLLEWLLILSMAVLTLDVLWGVLSRWLAAWGVLAGQASWTEELARYLMVSRQNLSGVIGRMERDGHVAVARGGEDRRSRMVTMTEHGRRLWQDEAQPKIQAYYEAALADFSGGDLAHALHYLLKLLDNMRRIEASQAAQGGSGDTAPV